MKALDQRYLSVYEALKADRGTPPPGEAFDLAIKKRAIDEFLNDESVSIDDLSETIDGYEDLIQKLKEVRSEARSPAPGQVSADGPKDHRSEALNKIFALQAAADGAVLGFRSEHLEAGLLDMSEVESWLEQAAQADGAATVWITVPAEALNQAEIPLETDLDRLPGYVEKLELLRYVADKARYTRSIPVRTEGVLAELAEISSRIAARYGWDEAATTTFILTGLLPIPRGIRADTTEPWPWPEARRRITLEVPLDATPSEVANLYRRLRDHMLGDEPRSRKSLTQRSADLAVFAAEHSSGHTWEEARKNWNRQHRDASEDQYTDSARFIRDSRSGYERVTGTSLEWSGKERSAAAGRSESDAGGRGPKE